MSLLLCECAFESWPQKRANPAAASARACGVVTAGESSPRDAKDTTVIAPTDARQPSADATSIRCDTAKSLNAKGNDAMTQMTQESAPPFQDRSWKGRGDVATERESDDGDPRTADATARRRVRPHQGSATGSCGRANPLIPKAATASDRTDRKNRRSIYFVGRRATRRQPRCAPVSVRCAGFPGPLLRLPCFDGSNCLIWCAQFPDNFPCSALSNGAKSLDPRHFPGLGRILLGDSPYRWAIRSSRRSMAGCR